MKMKFQWAVILVFFISYVSSQDLLCIECDSTTNSSCITNTSVFPATKCERGKCYTQNTNGDVKRGCVNVDPFQCADPACRTCDANKDTACNQHNICKVCDSSKDSACAQTDAGAAEFNFICLEANTKCMVTVKSNKHLERDCATNNSTCDDTSTCNICDGANCNGGIFPPNRKQCYQCSGPDCNNDAKDLKACLLYDANDKCFWYGNSETNMTRGCISDTDSTVNICGGNTTSAECRSCDTDKCNDGAYKVNQTLKCLQCENADTCQKEQKPEDAQECKNQITYTSNGTCYTQLKDGKTYRGCLYDRDETVLQACTSANKCNKCSDKDGCNKEEAKETEFTCIRCRSDEDSLCFNDADKITGKKCTKPIANDTQHICYHGTWYGVVTRGCLVDADERMNNTCTGTSDQCVTCTGANCNIKKSGATTIWVSISLMITILVTLFASI